MPYTPTVYVDGSAPDLQASNLNKLETAASKMPYALDGSVGQIPVNDGAGGITWKKLTASEVDAAAAIPASAIANYPADATKFLTGAGTWVSSTAASNQLDLATVTASPSAVTATTEGTSVAQITGNAVTYDGTQCLVSFYCPKGTAANSAVVTTLVFYVDSTVIGQTTIGNGQTTQTALFSSVLYTPSAGSHTFKVAAFVSTGSWTMGAGTGGSGNLVAAYLRVSKA